jgi:O-antigen ligase/tetratricopeptide (TPR) repeat protein
MRDFLKWLVYGSVFAMPFVLLIVSSSMFFPFITGKNFAFRILVEIGFAAWALLALIDRDYRPRWSWITVAVASLTVVMFFADLFGEYPLKSFWSNYERMEGWITLVHFFMYFLIMGSVLKTEVLWNRFLNTALVAAVIMSLYALGQIAGVSDVSQGGAWRVDARLGNSSYLGVYMLFHMFIAAWLFIRTKSTNLRYVYGMLFFAFGFILLRTGTRGATLGFIGGSVLAFSYLALMAPKRAAIKKWAAGGLLVVIIIAGSLWFLRDASFVKESPMLSRFTNISLAEGGIRFTIWQVALEGVKERPILGWGQENFSYVFNKYFDPALYVAEPWYDRTHNIFMDWLITGGVVGLVAYLSILATALWYAQIRPVLVRLSKGVTAASPFSVSEQALLLGLLAAYMFHNLFVFDNLASWIFYAVVLALIHSRVSAPIGSLEKLSINQETWERIVAPFGLLIAVVAAYLINAPGILAAQDIIDTYRAPTTTESLQAFERALNRGSFAEQEIVEQMTQVGTQRVLSPGISATDREAFVRKIEEALKHLVANKPGDARIHLITSVFYRMTGNLEQALKELEIAKAISPKKQVIYVEEGLVLLGMGKNEAAVERYQAAYDLDTRSHHNRVRLAAALSYVGDNAKSREVLDIADLDADRALREVAATDEMSLHLYHEAKQYDMVEYIFKGRKELYPLDSVVRTNLAALYYEMGDKARAIAVLNEAIDDIPAFEDEGRKLIKSLEAEK